MSQSQDTLIIVEGELDALSLREAGFHNVLSVPDGAPARVKDKPVPPAAADTKFSYVHRCWPMLERAKKVIIATDNDAAGFALAEELARRIGREKCWTVKWPTRRGDSILGSWVGAQQQQQQTVGASLELAGGGGGQGSGGLGVGLNGNGNEGQQGIYSGEGLHGSSNGSSSWSNGGSNGSSMSQQQQEWQQQQQQEGGGVIQLYGGGAGGGAVNDVWYRKDANEVLVKDGREALRAYVDTAMPLPIHGLHTFDAFWPEV